MQTVNLNASKELEPTLKAIYKEKGLNGVRAYLKRNNILYRADIHAFGLHTSKKAIEAKADFLNNNVLAFHYYSLGGRKNRNNGFTYNEIRAIQFIIL